MVMVIGLRAFENLAQSDPQRGTQTTRGVPTLADVYPSEDWNSLNLSDGYTSLGYISLGYGVYLFGVYLHSR